MMLSSSGARAPRRAGAFDRRRGQAGDQKLYQQPDRSARVRLKAAQDLSDRAGLAAAQIHKIVPGTDGPVIAFFQGVLSDPSALMDASPPDPAQPAIEAH
jgi:hypothetical protein